MDQETGRIKAHIDEERLQLERTLEEVEQRVRRATDLEGHFRKHPWLWTGGAFALGVLMARGFSGSREGLQRTSAELRQAGNVLDDILSVAVALGRRVLVDAIRDAVPEFDDELRRTRQRRHGSAPGHEEAAGPAATAGS